MRVLTADKIIEVSTVVKDRAVYFNDILDSVKVEYDNFYEAPWEHGDGWEHEFVGCGYYDHPNASQGWNYVNRPVRDGGCGYIVLDDDWCEKNLYSGYSGCSKQVRAESIAASKRKMMGQLVNWYENGWEWYCVYSEYDGYTTAIGGVDSYEYAEELREEIALEIAAQMESDGYIVEDKPKLGQPSKVDQYRDNKGYREKFYNPGNRSGCAKHGKRYYRHIQEKS